MNSVNIGSHNFIYDFEQLSHTFSDLEDIPSTKTYCGIYFYKTETVFRGPNTKPILVHFEPKFRTSKSTIISTRFCC